VPPGLPQVTIPAVSVQDIFALLPAALAILILIYADEILTSRVFAAKHGQKVDSNQEFVAIGMANIGAGLLMGFPAALSASRTAVADQMGGKTQWVGLIAAVLTIIFLLFLTPLLAPLHRRAGRRHYRRFARVDRHRRVSLPAAGASAEFCWRRGDHLRRAHRRRLGGILVAVMVSLITILYRISRPHDALLIMWMRAGGTVYRGVADKETALTEPA